MKWGLDFMGLIKPVSKHIGMKIYIGCSKLCNKVGGGKNTTNEHNYNNSHIHLWLHLHLVWISIDIGH
jgi:hypothetical protein